MAQTDHEDLSILPNSLSTLFTHLHTRHLTIRNGPRRDRDGNTQLQLSHQTTFGEMRPKARVVAGARFDSVIGVGRQEFVSDKS